MLKLRRKHRKNRVTTPTILQMEATECGAVSLAIILAYYKHYALIEEVRNACGISRDGSKAINIVKAARDYGLVANGNIFELDELKNIRLPCILHWEFNHFIVLEGFNKDKVYINDPALGPRIITIEELDHAFTGVALFFKPGKDFVKKGVPEPSILSMLWQRLYKSKIAFVFIIIATLLLVLPNIAIPAFTKIFIDNILIRDQQHWIKPLLLGMLFTTVLMGVITWLQQHYILRLRMKLQVRESSNFIWHLIHLPILFFQQRLNGDLIERIETNDELAELLTSELTSSMVGVFSMFFYALAILIISWPLAIISIVSVIFNFLALLYVQRRMIDFGRRFAQDRGKQSSIEMNGMQVIETIKANALEHQFFSRWAGYHAKTINSQQKLEIYSVLLNIFPYFLETITMAIILCLGAWFIIKGQLTIGDLVALQALLILLNKPLGELVELTNKLQGIKGKIVRLKDVVEQPFEHIVGIHPKPKKITKANERVLSVQSLTFGYSRLEPPIFEKFSFEVQKGQRIAIAGKTGCGKSSLSKLISGLYEPWEGEVQINHVPLACLSREVLSNNVAVIDQDIFLFEGTIRDNLSLWDENLPDEKMQQALKLACIDEIINERGGLDCKVAENGRNFSAGQRQRLEIARALVKTPSLLILDEATATLDTVVEKQIYSNLKTWGVALLIIAHRLSAIRDCDVIYVMQEGEIVQKGQHATLIAEEGPYKELISLE